MVINEEASFKLSLGSKPLRLKHLRVLFDEPPDSPLMAFIDVHNREIAHRSRLPLLSEEAMAE